MAKPWYLKSPAEVLGIGRGIEKVGTALGLPEWGLSEKYGNYAKTYDYLRPPKASAATSATPTTTAVGDGSTYTKAFDYTPPESTTPSGTPSAPNFAWWMGNKYNFDDPNSVTNYANARRDYINNIFGNKYSTGERQYNEGIESVNRDISNLGTNKADYLSDWQDQYNNLGKTYQGKRAGISNYYSGLGEGYQSSQGVREKNALDTFTQGTTKAERERARAEENFSQQEADLNKEKVDYGNWWTDLQRSIDEQKSQELDAIYQALDEAGATAEAQRLAAMGGDVNTRLRTNPYTAVASMNPLAETSSLANPVNSGIVLGGGAGNNPLVRSTGTDDASKAVNKYYNLIEQTGDPGKALLGLTATERQLLSSLGI